MARGSGSSGSYSYRDFAAAERARQQAAKQAERDRLAAESQARDYEAAARTGAIEQQVAEFESLLRSSLSRDPRIRLGSLRRTVTVHPLDLGPLATPIPGPQWDDYAPRSGGLQRVFSSAQRQQAALAEAQRLFGQAQREHQLREAERLRKVAESRAVWNRQATEAMRQVDAHNAHIDELVRGIRGHDRFAVSEYVQWYSTSLPTLLGSQPSGMRGMCLSPRWSPWNGSCPPSRSSRSIGVQACQDPQGCRVDRQDSRGRTAYLQRRHRPGRGAHCARGLRGHPAGHGQHSRL